MKMKRHRQPLEVMADMNVTNLLDTAFILLITFMLVAPQLTHGIKVSPPEVDDTPQIDVDKGKTAIIVIQKAQPGEEEEWIYLDNERIEVDDIKERLIEKVALQPEMNVLIEMDEGSTAGVFLPVVWAVKQSGIENIVFETKPVSTKKTPQ